MPHEALLLTPTLLANKPNILPGLARLHALCILIDGTLATFLPPLDPAVLTTWWETQWEQSQRGERAIIVVLSDDDGVPSENPSSTAEETAGLASSSSSPATAATTTAPSLSSVPPNILTLPPSVLAVVMLSTPFSQTGPHRGLIEKLLVSPTHRRLGLARLVMEKLEEVARERGRTNLMLDTTVGTPAETVYARLGWRVVGRVDRYGIHPLRGGWVDEVWFSKELR